MRVGGVGTSTGRGMRRQISFFPYEVLVPTVPSPIIKPVWKQFTALLPEHVDTHPLGCHNPRIPDRIVFDKLIQALVPGTAYERVADTTCSATTIHNRREWGVRWFV